MQNRLRPLAIVITAALATGCTGFERISDSTLSPTSIPAPAPSLVGTWASSSTSITGSSCTNLQWTVTSQSGNSLAGEFSAECLGGVTATGTASGYLEGDQVPYQITGIATVPGGVSCPVSISGTARLEGDGIRIPYSGTTCLGPIRGEEVLRRPTQPAPPPPPPAAPAPPPEEPPPPPPPPPPPGDSPFHVGPGPLSFERAEEVVVATADEYPHLLAPRPSEAEGVAAAAELLRRMIWHLQRAGFQAGRQKNPSGAISSDKLTIVLDGKWHAFDVFRAVATPGEPTEVIFLEVYPADPVPDGGIPD